MATALLSTLGTCAEIRPGYRVILPDTDHMIVIAAAKYPEAACNFEHPTVAAKLKKVDYTRAYWPDGRKKWFPHAVVSFYFVIPKDRIELVLEEGHSYVPVVINGKKHIFNVSGGGGGNEWTDHVREQVCIGMGYKIKNLKSLAEVALTVEEAKQRNITLDLALPEQDEDKLFTELVAAYDCREQLKTGHKLVLGDGYSFRDDDPKEFVIRQLLSKRRQFWVEMSPTGGLVPYDKVNWTKTAQANQIPLQSSGLVNYLKAAA